MPLSRQQRGDAYRIYQLIGERDMPSNNTAERLVTRSGIGEDRVLWALELLWANDGGFIRVDVSRGGDRGYYIDPKCRKKTPMDLDDLFSLWEVSKEDDEGQEDDSEDLDPDDEWAEMDEEDPED